MDGIWRIGDFARRVGVAAPTLRAWERRYGVLQPARTAAGYRLYTPADEARVRAMLTAMARGLAPAQAAARALADTPVAAGDAAVSTQDTVTALLGAVARYDAPAVEVALDQAFSAGPVPALRDVVLPALASIGDAWEREQIGVGHEHLATHLVERRLLGLSADWDEGPGPLALLACPSGERHTLGLLAFGIALAERGWRISYLGADTPLSQVHGAAQRLAPALVVLCALAAAPLHDRRGLAGVAASHRTLIGGAGATPALARAAGCEHLAGDPIGAARAVAA